jgi:hypothetical protein
LALNPHDATLHHMLGRWCFEVAGTAQMLPFCHCPLVLNQVVSIILANFPVSCHVVWCHEVCCLVQHVHMFSRLCVVCACLHVASSSTASGTSQHAAWRACIC